MTTALIIEDNEDNRVVMITILQSGGYTVIEAETGEQGYHKAVEEKPDFIMLDIQLPDIDGTEVLQRLCSNADTREIPVIACTSYAMSGDSQRLLDAGCDGYLEKPIDPFHVLSQIEKILREKV